MTVQELPRVLQDWVPWVLHGEQHALCPFAQSTDERWCHWPAQLTLTLDERSGRFAQSFKVYREGWVALPGSAKRWPQNVLADGKPAIVVGVEASGGAPSVWLTTGEHQITGSFLVVFSH
jgi:hypothetical protein